MRWFLSQTVVKWFKKCGILGSVRFKILRVAYKIFWIGSPRNGEWDFVLQWLRPLRKFQGNVSVLDVGCTESLLIYELLHRGYNVTGLDQRPYQEPHTFNFWLWDIAKHAINAQFDYILAVSTIEHVGLGAYSDIPTTDGDELAMINLSHMLKPNGYLIITIPNKHLGTPTGRGYSYQDFEKLLGGLYRIIHFEERSNQICAVLCLS